MNQSKNALWLRWVLANALGELFGLGATFAVIGLLVPRVDTGQTLGTLFAFGIAVLSGAVEATVVALAQWWAMSPWFPTVGRSAWWRATLIGAVVAYGLGYLPSTLMGMGESAAQVLPAEPPIWMTLALAASPGAVAGGVLSFAQWLVLRRRTRRAGLWIPANMLAWALGMPIIFLGMDVAFRMIPIWQLVAVIGGTLLVAGAVVGAVHGRFLLFMLYYAQRGET